MMVSLRATGISAKQSPVATKIHAQRTILILAITLASCRGDSSVILHPTPENVQKVTDPRFVIHEDLSDTVAWVDLSPAQGVLIGVKDGPPLEMIGVVRDLDISTNSLFYADFVYGHVRVYDFRGNLTSVVGKRGEGPGEFPQVTKLAVMENDTGPILVVGASGNQIAVFQQTGSTWVEESRFTTAHAFMHGDLCAMHDHVYSIGYSEEHTGVIHKYTLGGEYALSFGNIYSDELPFIRSALSPRGALDCNETQRVIAYAHDLSSVVTGFSDRGIVRWRVHLADVNPRPHVQRRTKDGRPSIVYAPPAGLFSQDSHTSSIRFIPRADSEAFTVSYYSPGSKSADTMEKQHIFNIDAASGDGAYKGWHDLLKGSNKQPWVTALDAQRVYTSRSVPYPQLGVYLRADVSR